MDKVIVSPHGGLGNVLFQVAACLFISKNLDKKPMLASRRLSNYKIHSTKTSLEFCKRFLPIQCPSIYDTRIVHKLLLNSRFLKDRYVFTNDLQNSRNTMFYLPDYYQFSDIALRFKHEFYQELKRLDKKNSRIMHPNNCAAVHVRRGDYYNKKNEDLYGVCDESYYNSAISLLKQSNADTKIHVFSDDIEWCRKNLREIDRFHTGGSELTDILTLSSYQVKILSNSTFSAWAGYFSPNGAKVFVPKYWKKDVKSVDTGILAHGWIVL